MGRQTERTHHKGVISELIEAALVDWAVPHSCADRLGGTTRKRDRLSKPGFQCRRNKASKPLT